MEVSYIVELLDFLGFTRSRRPFSLPLVVHGVAGSGKTYLLRKVSSHFPHLVHCSFAPQIIDSNSGRKQAPVTSEPTDLLDEYLGGPNPLVRLLKVCDPLQYDCPEPEVPHYVSLTTRRFCPLTTTLLNSLFGCDIVSLVDRNCHIQIHDPYTDDPIGTVVSLSPDIGALLLRHGCATTPIADLWDVNLSVVSCYLHSLEEALTHYRAPLFLTLTRHTAELHIFLFDARTDAAHELRNRLQDFGHRSS
ncbi:triple gene block protein 1 [Asparagus virus 3]|uniref:Triple gene block protein 1 n=1 Tax=Asparagus virus 3 TaxID=445435 RepID=Q8QXK8_9VIRU|nr:triple gene block protein 1 [Asparagus virus 3]CAC87087.1 triple gene block protein 1 [Asparagus virus 3]